MISIRAGLAALSVICASVEAQAQTQPISWRGFANIVAASPECAPAGWSVGNTFTYAHRPRFVSGKNDLADNGPDTYLNLYTIHNGMSYRLAGRDIRGAGPFNASGIALISRGGWSSVFTSEITSATTTPVLSQTTMDSISIELTINNFFNSIAGPTSPNCVVTIRGSATRRP